MRRLVHDVRDRTVGVGQWIGEQVTPSPYPNEMFPSIGALPEPPFGCLEYGPGPFDTTTSCCSTPPLTNSASVGRSTRSWPDPLARHTLHESLEEAPGSEARIGRGDGVSVVRCGNRAHYQRFFTHLERESLPTAGWGYEHFPLSARYVDTPGMPFLGMTGKFHYHWGEIGGYKEPDALLYECGAMLAQGACCSIGDHLHPSGAIDASTMAVIAPAYAWVAEREGWVRDSVNRADVGLVSAEAVRGPTLAGVVNHKDRMNAADTGAVRVLLEAKIPFDVLDLESELSAYRLVVLPDVIEIGAALAERLQSFIDDGGRVFGDGAKRHRRGPRPGARNRRELARHLAHAWR